jgi:hypothetical protein
MNSKRPRFQLSFCNLPNHSHSGSSQKRLQPMRLHATSHFASSRVKELEYRKMSLRLAVRIIVKQKIGMYRIVEHEDHLLW